MTWATGKQVADRYNLAQAVDAISWSREPDKTYSYDGHSAARGRAGVVIGAARLSEQELSAHLGREVAEKIINNRANSGILENLDLRIGGKGKAELYDKLIPNFLSKYTKRWGGKVGKSGIETGAPKLPKLRDIEDFDQSELALEGAENFPSGESSLVSDMFHVTVDGLRKRAAATLGADGINIVTWDDLHMEPDNEYHLDGQWQTAEQARRFFTTFWDTEAPAWNRFQSAEGEQHNLAPLIHAIEDVHSLKITPEMSEAIRKVGQPMFGTSEGEPPMVIDARARLAESLSGKRMNVNPMRDLVDTGIITGWQAYKGISKFKDWSVEMVKQLGEEIKPHLEWLWDQMAEFAKNEEGALRLGGKREPDEKLIERTKKRYGVTKDPDAAGLIFPDGSMLDLTGLRGPARDEIGAIDHYDMVEAMIKRSDDEAVPIYMRRTGAVRVQHYIIAGKDYKAISHETPLTEEQTRQILGFASEVGDYGVGNPSDYTRGLLYIKRFPDGASKLELSKAIREGNAALEQQASEGGFLNLPKIFQKKQQAQGTGQPAQQLQLVGPQPSAASKFWDYVSSYWYNNVLSGSSTHSRNTIANLIWMTATNIPERAIKGAVSLAWSKATGTPQEHYIREVLPAMQGLLVGLPKGAKDAIDIMRGKPPASAARGLQQANIPHLELPGGIVTNLPSRALSAADAIARSMNEQAELYAMATKETLKAGLSGRAAAAHMQQLVTSPTPRMLAAMKKAGERGTFTGEPDRIEKQFLKLRDVLKIPADVPLLGGFSAGRFMIPFVSVPYKILKGGIELTPTGFLKLASEKGRHDRATAQATAATALFGTAITAALIPHALAGGITGAAPGTPKEKKDFYDQGLQPYSIKIGDRWVSYRYWGPVAFPIALAGATVDLYRRYGTSASTNTLAPIITSIGKLAADASFLQGIGDLLDSLDEEKKIAKQEARLVGGLVPYSGLLRNIAQARDKVPDSGVVIADGIARDPKTLYDFVTEGIPGLRERIPQKSGERGIRKGAAGLVALGPGALPPVETDTKPELEKKIVEAIKREDYDTAESTWNRGIEKGHFGPEDNASIDRLRDQATMSPLQFKVRHNMDMEEALNAFLDPRLPAADKESIAALILAKEESYDKTLEGGRVPKAKADRIDALIEKAKQAGIWEMSMPKASGQ